MEPRVLYKIEIRAMDNGQLLVSYPPDEYPGQKLATRLLDAAKVVVDEQQKRIVQPVVGSAFDVRPHLTGASK